MNHFVDEVSFEVEGGHGGAGCVSFRKEPHAPMGGPDGGNGGDGGNVIIVVDARINSFGKIKSKRKFRGRDGDAGFKQLMDGKRGEDAIIKVPVGTVVYNEEDNSILADLTAEGETFIVAYGGKGGKGNKFYATATNQAPDYAQHGLDGESLTVRLEVKLIADIGLVGFPNAGKSSLLARITRANPKIAAYPFTTLTPNLGVCYLDIDRSFIIADIPGIIEGASEGAGLGLTFLRHIERTEALAFLVDITEEDFIDKYKKLILELKKYSKELTEKKYIVVLNKTDMLDEDEVISRVKDFKKSIKSKNIIDVFALSVFSSTDDEFKTLAETFYNTRKKDEDKEESKQVIVGTLREDKKEHYVFGPVLSKRLGKSLGIDVLPFKTCSYNCIYCQLGSEEKTRVELGKFYSVDEIIFELRDYLNRFKDIDYITFTGSGEPTLYSELKKLIAEIKSITDIPLCVITNGSLLYKQEIRSSLMLCDVVIPSLDAGDIDTFKKINRPNSVIDFEKMINGLVEFSKVFKGEVWLEVFILDGINDSEESIIDIAKLTKKINPDKVQLITATRPSAEKYSRPVDNKKLEAIASLFSKYFSGTIEIPEVNIKRDNKDYKEVSDTDILESLLRQPDTIKNVSIGLQAEESKVEKIVKELLKAGRIDKEIINKKEIYKVRVK